MVRERKPGWDSHCESKVPCPDVGAVFVMLQSRLSFEYLIYHSLEPFLLTPRLVRVLMLTSGQVSRTLLSVDCVRASPCNCVAR